MNKACAALCLTLMSLAGSAWGASHLVLASAPASVIVVGQGASELELFAATQLHQYIRETTGVEVPLRRDDDIDSDHRQLIVSVGRTRYVTEAHRQELQEANTQGQPPAFLIKKEMWQWTLLGADDQGTAHAGFEAVRQLQSHKADAGGSAAGKRIHLVVPENLAVQRADEAFLAAFAAWGKPVPMPDAQRRQRAKRAAQNAAAGGHHLVHNGQAAAVIVVGQYAVTKELFAARELQKYVREMTGQELPIQLDTQTPPSSGHMVVSIGRTSYVNDAIASELRLDENIVSMEPFHDAYLVQKTPGVLYLIGHREQATVWAVYDLLESLGCRWFLACEAGTIIPRNVKSLEVKAGRELKVPDFALRHTYSWYRDQPDTQELAWTQIHRFSENMDRIAGSHNMDQILPARMFDEHPEYFSMDAKGQRIKPKMLEHGRYSLNDWQPCLTHPAVIQMAADWAEKKLQKSPVLESVTFAANDGGGYCECPECTKIGNRADLQVHFANEVSKKLFPKYPKLYINIWAYYQTAYVPALKADEYEQNTDRVICTIFENYAKTPYDELIEGWSKSVHRLHVSRVWRWSNHARGPRCNPWYVRDGIEKFREYKQRNVMALSLHARGDWANNGMDRYLAAKKMWNTQVELEPLIQDFAEKMFPSATAEYRQLLALWDEAGKLDLVFNRPISPADRAAFIGQGLALLEKMRAKLKTQEEQARWTFYAVYFHEQVLELEMILLEKEKDKDAQYAKYKEMAAYLKAIEPMRAVESRQIIREVLWRNILKKFDPNIPTAGNLRYLPDIAPMALDDAKIAALYEQDRAKYRPTALTGPR